MKKIISAALAALMFVSTAYAQDFIRGGDITELNYIEDLGGKFYDRNGVEGDALEILAKSGMNMARVRLSNNPGKGTGDGTYYLPAGYQDEADCLDLAKRAKAAGMGIEFTFNYSDYWSNGTRQIIPSEWVKQIKEELGVDVKDADFLNKMTAEQRSQIQDLLEKIVYEYTLDIMRKLKNQDTVPEYVSLGNETRGGMLFPFANTYDASMNRNNFELVFGDDVDEKNDIKCPEDWDFLVRIMNAGYKAVKEVSEDTQVAFHLDGAPAVGKFTWYIDEIESRGAMYDVIGASYYPAWSDDIIENCVTFCDELSEKYDKDVLIMETGFNWNDTIKDGSGGQLVDIEAYKDVFPPTQEGHKGYITSLCRNLRSVKNDRCIGFLYWDPLMIHVEDKDGNNLSGWAYRESDDGVEKNIVENTTLFDFDGKAIESLDAYKQDMEDNLVTGIKTVYDENGVLTEVKVEQTDIRNKADFTYVWDGTKFIK